MEHLRLNGKEHQQIACLCIAKNNEILWQHHETAHLTLRHFSEKTIESYLQSEKPYHNCGVPINMKLKENGYSKKSEEVKIPFWVYLSWSLAKALMKLGAVSLKYFHP